MTLAKAKKILPNENFGRKGENVFTERRFRCINSFSHFDAFSPGRATFSIGKHIFVQKISSANAFSRLCFRFARLCEPRFRSVESFSYLRGNFSLHKPFFDFASLVFCR